jgi:hypothetical protein
VLELDCLQGLTSTDPTGPSERACSGLERGLHPTDTVHIAIPENVGDDFKLDIITPRNMSTSKPSPNPLRLFSPSSHPSWAVLHGPVPPKPPTHIPTAYSIFSLLSVVSSLLENRCLTLPNSLAFFEMLVVELAELQALLRRRCGYPDGASDSVASAGLPGRCQRGTHKSWTGMDGIRILPAPPLPKETRRVLSWNEFMPDVTVLDVG